ncbi:unnamed protein product [Gulo gulo]|uniref:Immunoglobulin V-set domain-containing protein n=1 Tax=Gulo gulo TaxID=48420 RepID=A0A9X9LGG6_GULGU|nr:unnamed protein product [Gulo gulo]
MGSSAILFCRARITVKYLHLYHHQKGKALQRLLLVSLLGSYVQMDLVLKGDKIMTKRGTDGKSCTLLILKLEKSDKDIYYCAAWELYKLASLPGPSTKGLSLSGCSRPDNFHWLWVPGVALGCPGVGFQHPDSC